MKTNQTEVREKMKYLEIKRNRDSGGYILTYSVEIGPGVWVEYNTLKEARVMASAYYDDADKEL